MNFRLARDQVVLLEARANWCASRRRANNFFRNFFSIFELRCIKTKHLMTGREGNSEFCFPKALNVHRGKAEGNIESLGETKLSVPSGQVIN